MFSVRIVNADYYIADPIKDLDVCYSEFRESVVKKVPVVRIFGATPGGNLFITYSIDTAEDIPGFVSFLMTQGFRPAIDMFDDPVRRLDINKWMDSFLKDKSVLIIMVISPKYKIDIEGDGLDAHGLHTKYIHSQLQNEFIQQRCLNFRLVPVLFPNATRDHVPIWLQSTRIYRWPQDMQDLLLRLLREERYIAPPMGKELTLTIRPI